MKELFEIQQRLKVPKEQFNNFSGYNFRSCEDILEAVKPILKELKCTLKFSDDVISIGNRIYVKTELTITNDDGEDEKSIAFAREPEHKKGFDESQITGASSSYARKYCLNGLLAIDDTRDADNFDNTKIGEASQKLDKVIQQPSENALKQKVINKARELYKNKKLIEGHEMFEYFSTLKNNNSLYDNERYLRDIKTLTEIEGATNE
jgi:hypothetical protein